MNPMKYIILSFLFGCFIFCACTKEAKYDPAEEFQYTVKKNAYRVTKISGTSTYWGDFTLSLNYSGDELDKAYRTNAENDTIGQINVNRNSSTYLKYSIMDLIPNIDQDSIARTDAILRAKYGAGNYSLWDSIPKIYRTIQETISYLYTDGRIKKVVSNLYKPREDVGITGVNFDNSYIRVSKTASTYEYDLNSNIAINRIILDVYNEEDQDKYERTLLKYETNYDREQIGLLICSIANGGESFIETNRYNYTYNGNQLISVDGVDFTRKFTYTGKQVTMTTNDSETIIYELDEHGNVIQMDDGKGNVFHIEYEQGNGNFSIFTLMNEQMINPFFIK